MGKCRRSGLDCQVSWDSGDFTDFRSHREIQKLLNDLRSSINKELGEEDSVEPAYSRRDPLGRDTVEPVPNLKNVMGSMFNKNNQPDASKQPKSETTPNRR